MSRMMLLLLTFDKHVRIPINDMIFALSYIWCLTRYKLFTKYFCISPYFNEQVYYELADTKDETRRKDSIN